MSANKGLPWWSPSTAGGTGLIPTGGTKIPQATWQDPKKKKKKLKAFPLRLRTKPLGLPTGSHREERNTRRDEQKGKQWLISDNMIVYVENPNEYRHKLLLLLRQFSNVARHKFNNKNQRQSSLSEQIMRIRFGKLIIYNHASKTVVLGNKYNKE